MALPTVVDFESLSDGDVLTNQLTGLTFTNALVESAGLLLNDAEFPPHSGTNVITDNGGSISIDFATPVDSVGGYFTYVTPLSLSAYAGANLIASVTSAFSANYVSGGDSGSTPNEFLSLAGSGITQLTISGDPNGGSFTLDDLSYTVADSNNGNVPEPGSLPLVFSGLPLLWAGRKLRGLKSAQVLDKK